MKTLLCVFVASLLGGCVGAHEIELHAVNRDGKPISDVDVLVSFDYEDRTLRRGKTDEMGGFFASGDIRPAAFVKLTKPGFYGSEIRTGLGRQDHRLSIVMHEIKKPIPLVVRDLELAIPKDAGRIGVDLEAGDWVAPFGKGTVSDFEVRFSNSFSGYQYSGEEWDRIRFAKVNANLSEEALRDVYGKWDAAATITASGGLGFVFEEPDFNPFSELTMPHEAPEEGYGPKFEMEGSTYDSSRMEIERRPLFLRTRAEVRDGKVVRANYVKLPEGIQLDARGSLRFTYYFNPRANDRNLEFDPRQNLAKEQERSYPP